jgi:hypothetical protein
VIFNVDDTLSSTPFFQQMLPEDPLVEESSTNAKYPMFTLRAINGELHAAFLQLVGTGGSWVVYKSGGYTLWEDFDDGYAPSAGPRFTQAEIGREMNAEFFSCNDGLHLAFFLKLASGDVMFNLVSTANLPDPPTYTLADWEAEFA